ncbi:MAG TPA: hypothetical protein DCP11_01665 [Microbacteriaceae bacterium]|nr:hypothetical protein [Microbacteriaceae bacterium]
MSTPFQELRQSRWFRAVWLAAIALVVLAGLILGARGLRATTEVQSFLATYSGESELPDGTPVGFPAWVGWQHFLNSLFLLLIIRTGWQIRTTTRPTAFWTRRNTPPFKTKNPPTRIALHVWLHFTLDALWVLNGIVFFVLLFSTGQWVRLVPVSWDVMPNALSAALQYLSLEWPVENGWLNYNALQLLAYFTTVFIAAPLAIFTGIRMSPAWSKDWTRASRIYPITVARKIHFPVMLYFVLFVIVHVTLVIATGALRNLNHMYAGRDDGTWWGAGIFALSVLVMVGVWMAARPVFVRQMAALTGTLGR